MRIDVSATDAPLVCTVGHRPDILNVTIFQICKKKKILLYYSVYLEIPYILKAIYSTNQNNVLILTPRNRCASIE